MSVENALKKLREYRARGYPILVMNFLELDRLIAELDPDIRPPKDEDINEALVDRAVMKVLLRIQGIDEDMVSSMTNSEMLEALRRT